MDNTQDKTTIVIVTEFTIQLWVLIFGLTANPELILILGKRYFYFPEFTVGRKSDFGSTELFRILRQSGDSADIEVGALVAHGA